MVAYEVDPWKDLFVAAAGASAALAGLVFVAVSINVERILQYKGLPERALSTVMLLLGVVVVALLGLVPERPTETFAIELLVLGVVLTAVCGFLTARGRPDGDTEESHLLSAALITVPGSLPYVLAGITLLAESGGGMYWVLAGLLGGMIGGVLNAWVLLVEILR